MTKTPVYSIKDSLYSALKNSLATLATIGPREESEPKAFAFLRGLVWVSLFSLPLLYDITVPEVAGDPRWALLHTVPVAAAAALFFFTKHIKLELTCLLVLGVLATAILSGIEAITPYRYVEYLRHFLAYGVLFFVVLALWTPRWQRTLLWALVLPILVNAPMAFAQFLGYTDAQLPFPFNHMGILNYFQQVTAPSATFANKNLLASWLVLTVPLAAFLAWQSPRKFGRLLAASLACVGVVALAFSRSRASWVALIVAVVAFGLWVAIHPTLRQKFAQPLLWAIGGLVLVFCAGLFVPSGLKTYNFKASVGEHLGRLYQAQETDLMPRVAYNLNSLHIVADHPLNGVGLGGFQGAYPRYHQAQIPTPELGYNLFARPQRAHNDLMQAFVEQGILGGLLHIALFVWGLFMAVKLAKTGEKSALFLGVSLTGIGVNALMDFPLQMPTSAALLMVILACLAGAHQRTFPKTWHKTLPMPKAAAWSLAGLMLAASLVAAGQDIQHRKGAQALKIAMGLVVSNTYNAQTKEAIDEAFTFAPTDGRTLEFLSVIYTNLQGNLQQTPDKRIEIAELTNRQFPYSANNLISLGWGYYLKATRLAQHGQTLEATAMIHQVLGVVKTLRLVAPFTAHTEGLAGLAYLFLGKNVAAEAAFQAALTLQPDYEPALAGMSLLKR